LLSWLPRTPAIRCCGSRASVIGNGCAALRDLEVELDGTSRLQQLVERHAYFHPLLDLDDASQYKDYVLFMLFIKYISDKYGNSADFAPPVAIPRGAS
jgi:hypothetical protein